MQEHNGHGPQHEINPEVPLLGQKGYVNSEFKALVRHLVREGEPGPVGTVVTDLMLGKDGKPVPVIRRDLYVDAEELVEMIRLVVREELKAWANDPDELGLVT